MIPDLITARPAPPHRPTARSTATPSHRARRHRQPREPTGATPPTPPPRPPSPHLWAELLDAAHHRPPRQLLRPRRRQPPRHPAASRGCGRRVFGATLQGLFDAPALEDFAATLKAPTAPPRSLGSWSPIPTTGTTRSRRPTCSRPTGSGAATTSRLGGVGSHWYWEFDGAGVDVTRLEGALEPARRPARDAARRLRPRRPPADPADGAARDDHARRSTRDGRARARCAASGHVAPGARPGAVAAVRRPGGPLRRSRTRLAFSFDYIVLDALSIMIVFTELGRALRGPGRPSLPPVGMSFRDYVLSVHPDPQALATRRGATGGRGGDTAAGARAAARRSTRRLVSSPRFVRRDARLAAAQWTAHRRAAPRTGSPRRPCSPPRSPRSWPRGRRAVT